MDMCVRELYFENNAIMNLIEYDGLRLQQLTH